MGDRLLYINKHASHEAFLEAMQAFLAAGYQISTAPARNRDGFAARLKKEEEVRIEWFSTDALAVSAVFTPSERLRAEVTRVIGGVIITEVRII